MGRLLVFGYNVAAEVADSGIPVDKPVVVVVAIGMLAAPVVGKLAGNFVVEVADIVPGLQETQEALVADIVADLRVVQVVDIAVDQPEVPEERSVDSQVVCFVVQVHCLHVFRSADQDG